MKLPCLHADAAAAAVTSTAAACSMSNFQPTRTPRMIQVACYTGTFVASLFLHLPATGPAEADCIQLTLPHSIRRRQIDFQRNSKTITHNCLHVQSVLPERERERERESKQHFLTPHCTKKRRKRRKKELPLQRALEKRLPSSSCPFHFSKLDCIINQSTIPVVPQHFIFKRSCLSSIPTSGSHSLSQSSRGKGKQRDRPFSETRAEGEMLFRPIVSFGFPFCVSGVTRLFEGSIS